MGCTEHPPHAVPDSQQEVNSTGWIYRTPWPWDHAWLHVPFLTLTSPPLPTKGRSAKSARQHSELRAEWRASRARWWRAAEPCALVATSLPRSPEAHLHLDDFQDQPKSLKFYRIYSFTHLFTQQAFIKCCLPAETRTKATSAPTGCTFQHHKQGTTQSARRLQTVRKK